MRGAHVPATGTTSAADPRGPRAPGSEQLLARAVPTAHRCGGTELTVTP